MLYNGQTETRSTYFSRPVSINAIETLKQPQQMLLFNSNTIVRYFNQELIVKFKDFNRCFAVLNTVLNAVYN